MTVVLVVTLSAAVPVSTAAMRCALHVVMTRRRWRRRATDGSEVRGEGGTVTANRSTVRKGGTECWIEERGWERGVGAGRKMREREAEKEGERRWKSNVTR